MSSQPLLPNSITENLPTSTPKRRAILTTALIPLLLIIGIIYVSVRGENIPKDSLGKANYYLKSSPVIDGHVDLPELARQFYGNDINAFDLNKNMPGHVDIPRIKKGHLGGLFWSIFTECRDHKADFLDPQDEVRDTLEQIDLSLNLINKYDDTFQLCKTADDIMKAIGEGKVASMLGVEGGHSLGNSLGVLRIMHNLGVRYMTLTHGCNNVFADSGGIFETVEPTWNGLSPLGKELIKEMNRVGILIDLSHVSDKTASQALAITRAPVIWSHSCARHFNNISRNVPDYVLDKIGRGKHQIDGVVMINFFPLFATTTPDIADVKTIADHVTYISDRIGKHHVGIGSDYDGVDSLPAGLEDVSKYPHLFAEMIERGWGQDDLAKLAGGNLLRVMRGMEAVSAKMKKEGKGPSMAVYDKRTDLGRHRGPV